MAAIAIVVTTEMAQAERWDAESFQPELRRLEKAVGGQSRLCDVAHVTHPAEITRHYTGNETGTPFLLAANIRAILPDLSAVSHIPSVIADQLPTNRLETEDVLVTRTGANHGVACVYLGESGEFYTSGEGVIVRPLPGIDGAYLGAFLGSRYGHTLCQKAAYGSGQPHISPSYLRKLPILRLGKSEAVIGALVREAWRNRRDALPLYAEAQAEMLNQAGWEKFIRPRLRLWHVEHHRDIERVGRCDADFFSPRAKALPASCNPEAPLKARSLIQVGLG
jgi:hypothetical protein